MYMSILGPHYCGCGPEENNSLLILAMDLRIKNYSEKELMISF